MKLCLKFGKLIHCLCMKSTNKKSTQWHFYSTNPRVSIYKCSNAKKYSLQFSCEFSIFLAKWIFTCNPDQSIQITVQLVLDLKFIFKLIVFFFSLPVKRLKPSATVLNVTKAKLRYPNPSRKQVEACCARI